MGTLNCGLWCCVYIEFSKLPALACKDKTNTITHHQSFQYILETTEISDSFNNTHTQLDREPEVLLCMWNS